MSDYSYTRYLVNRNNQIEFTDKAWEDFAGQNGGEKLMNEMVLYRDISSFISCARCQELYDMLINSVRGTRKAIEFPFRCDSPDMRRFMKMEMIPLDQEKIEFTSYTEKEEARPPIYLLDISVPRSEEIITICSWCKRIKTDNAHWLDMEEAVEKMELFNSNCLPKLSHGICSSCFETVMKKIG
ncbi:hypothetical protein [Candidatus Electrothrix sp.]|uniref:hypothetical protein n=1 Tax=Candidatus Electrothrix sp. TaxID=2170559 RepID=UPI004056520F